mmetsp:Transcript_21723/g.66472  ORF Transcript_21723/g.66472 Transcript_21723/m.66472 type:complete len:216 (+) Transcript_21723:308-955(+)
MPMVRVHVAVPSSRCSTQTTASQSIKPALASGMNCTRGRTRSARVTNFPSAVAARRPKKIAAKLSLKSKCRVDSCTWIKNVDSRRWPWRGSGLTPAAALASPAGRASLSLASLSRSAPSWIDSSGRPEISSLSVFLSRLRFELERLRTRCIRSSRRSPSDSRGGGENHSAAPPAPSAAEFAVKLGLGLGLGLGDVSASFCSFFSSCAAAGSALST